MLIVSKSKRTSPFFVLISGSRGFNNYRLFRKRCFQVLKSYVPDDSYPVIISGMARGADMLAVRLAKERNWELIEMPANWDGLGKRAGYVRNAKMVKKADLAICFWDGVSRGTAHAIGLAEDKDIPVFTERYKEIE